SLRQATTRASGGAAERRGGRCERLSMTKAGPDGAHTAQQPPALARDAQGEVGTHAHSNVIEWLLDHDPRVNLLRSPQVEEIFQWKQAAGRAAGEEVYQIGRASCRERGEMWVGAG